ncbi:hypothetical protein NQ314_007516, partial [Rhamnusium bicolor]
MYYRLNDYVSGTKYNDEEFINNNFENITAVTNTTLLLQCPKKSNKIKWKLLNHANSTNGKILQTNSDTFELRPISSQDNGVYGCFANESDIIKIYNITVFEPPHFTKNMEKHIFKPAGSMTSVLFSYKTERFPSKPYIKDGYPQNLTIVENRTAIFECPQIIADLEPYIQWVRIHNYSEVGDDYTKLKVTYLQKSNDDNVNPEVYQITNVTHEDEG